MSSVERKNLLGFGFVRESCDNKTLESIPKEIIELFILWISLSDSFAEIKCHPSIKIETINNKNQGRYTVYRHSDDGKAYESAIGKDIISKTEKQEWIIELERAEKDYAAVLIGVIADKTVQENEYIHDFTSFETGYGFSPVSCNLYNANNWGKEFEYAKQFKIKEGIEIKMTLDMSQENETYGTLSYEFNASENVVIDEDVNNIAFDDIDMDQSYRLVIAFHYAYLGDVVKIALLF